MDEMAATLPFPPGLEHDIVYDPTQFFIQQSIDEVFVTLYQAVGLVVLTVFVFLGSWRATLIPAAAIPGEPRRHVRGDARPGVQPEQP